MGDAHPDLDDRGYVRPGVTFTESLLGIVLTVLGPPTQGDKWLVQRIRTASTGRIPLTVPCFAAHTLRAWWEDRVLTNCNHCHHRSRANRLPCWRLLFDDPGAEQVQVWRRGVGLPARSYQDPTDDQVGCPKWRP